MSSSSPTSSLVNPLASAEQLDASSSQLDGLPAGLENSVRFASCRFIQAAGMLLRLSQDITAQAMVIYARYWVGAEGGSLRIVNAIDIAIASLYMLAKLSADPQSPRNVLNVAAYLVTHPRAYLFPDSAPADDARFDQLTSDGAYHSRRTALVKHEALLLRALGFQTHVALPFTLSINYLQTLDAFQKPLGRAAARQTFAHLNSALLSPQLLYLTHQPAQLATAAIYLACKQVGLKLPEEDWWLIFDTDREELGFLIVAFTSMDSFAEAERRKWKGRDVPLTVASLSDELDVPGHLHPHTSQPVAPDAS